MRYRIVVLALIVNIGWIVPILVAEQNALSESSGGQPVGGTPYADYIIGQATTYQNLSIFPILSKVPKNQDRYTTLDEGLASGSVKIVEVGAQQQETATTPSVASGEKQQARQTN